MHIKNKLKLNTALFVLASVVIIDLWSFNSNYVNSDDFVNKSKINKPFEASQIDQLILNDNSDFRVYEPYRGFSNGKTSYFHKSISGYNAAKPQRMQNIFDFYLFKNNTKVLDMLNVKYIVELDNNNSLSLKVNENAKGNAWFVEKIQKTQSANEELLSLDKINLSNIALSKDLDNKTYVLNDTNSIKLNSRKANELIYEVKSDSDQFVVFSEAFYKKGWKATIEGKEHPHFKVNYLLRGMEVPQGEYSLKFSFDPPVIKTGSMISIFSFVILLLSVLVYFKRFLKMYKKIPSHRYNKTLKMLKDILPKGGVIYDLGVRNPFSKIMEDEGFKVYNSSGQDFDDDFELELPNDVDLITGFEILEHLVSPYPLLKNLKCNKLFVTVPLKLWFANAYRSKTDSRDRHYHEFEAWQFDWLLEKSGWSVKKKNSGKTHHLNLV